MEVQIVLQNVQKSQSQTTFIQYNLWALQLHRGEDTLTELTVNDTVMLCNVTAIKQ